MLRNLMSRIVEIVTSEMPTAASKKNRRGKRGAPYHRGLHLESLENRELLTVNPADWLQLQSLYADLNLDAQGTYNVIEVGATNPSGANEFAFSLQGIQDAITRAGQTTERDIIVVRTTESQNTITYASWEDALSININAASYGSVTIVSLGTSPLTIDAAQQSRVMSVESSTVALAGLTITGGNITNSNGGGIYSTGTLTVTSSEISGNTVSLSHYDTYSYFGGGIYSSGTLMVTNSTISGNTASGGTSGGGIYSSGMLMVTDSTISGNTVVWGGGGGIHGNGVLTITNSTISGNTAVSGGGIYNGGTLTVTNSTISGNAASSGSTASYWGGGIFSEGTLSINNTIVAKNNTDVYRYHGTVTGSNNLIGNGENQTLVNGVDGNIVGTAANPIDPKIGELTKLSNGQMIHPLLSGSPAIDAGNNSLVPSGITTDQAGNTRIAGARVDIGAVEGVTETPRSGVTYYVTSLADIIDANDGILTFTEALMAANYNIAVGSAVAGSFTEKDRIVFSPGLTGTVKLTGSALTVIGSVDIDAAGANIIFDGDNKSGVFVITTSGINVSLNNVTITGGNASSSFGGGIYNNGTLTVTNSTISGNKASSFPTSATFSRGGGIYNNGTLMMTNSTISGNKADGGGGICDSGTLTVTNSTISGNSSFGIFGLYCFGTTSLNNSIVALNQDGDINYYVGTIQGFNNLTSLTGWHGLSGNNLVYNGSLPLFVNADVGDYRLAADSQAIDKGDSAKAVYSDGSAIQKDLAGNARIYNGTVDIGAYEYDGTVATPLVAPTGLTLTATSSSAISVTWSTVPNAGGYAIQYSTTSDFSSGNQIQTVGSGSTTAILSELTANTPYYVHVMATGTGDYTDSAYSTAQSATTKKVALGTPTLNAVTVDHWGLNLAWDSVAYATGYVIEYSTKEDFASIVGTQIITSGDTTWTTSSRMAAGLAPNTQYYVRIKATSTNMFADSDYAKQQAATGSTVALGLLSLNTTTKVTKASMIISWNKIANAAGYIVEYSTDAYFTDSKTVDIKSGATVTTTLTKLVESTEYHIRVTAKVPAKGGFIASPNNAIISQKTTNANAALAAPKLTAFTNVDPSTTKNNASLEVKWQPVSGASGYIVQYSTDGFKADVREIAVDSTETSQKLTALLNNKKYSVRVIALGTETIGNSAVSAAKAVTTLKQAVAPPMNVELTAGNTAGTVKVNWDWSQGESGKATGYTVQFSTSSAFTKVAKSVTVKTAKGQTVPPTSCNVTGLTAGTKYYVRVVAIGATGYANSAYTIAIKTVTVLAKPVILAKGGIVVINDTPTDTQKKLEVKWNTVADASSYKIEYADNAKFTGAKIETANADVTSFTLTELVANKTYYVRIVALGAEGESNIYGTSAISAVKSGKTAKVVQ